MFSVFLSFSVGSPGVVDVALVYPTQSNYSRILFMGSGSQILFSSRSPFVVLRTVIFLPYAQCTLY